MTPRLGWGGGGGGRGETINNDTLSTVLPSLISLMVSVDVKHHVYNSLVWLNVFNAELSPKRTGGDRDPRMLEGGGGGTMPTATPSPPESLVH